MELIQEQFITNKIYLIRNQKVMLDQDLALLYGVETKVLNQSVKRNVNRFPPDFMFELTKDEFITLRSQFVTSNKGGRTYLPKAFTEQGVAMLSSVLNSETAISVNIQIIRIFSKLRQMNLNQKDILLKLEEMEGKVGKHEEEIQAIFSALKQLLNTTPESRDLIGFKVSKK